jgi:hypothetical protein
MKNKFVLFSLVVLLIMILAMCCSGSGGTSKTSKTTSGSGKKTYTCGYCGTTMTGGYYDYFNGKYACRSCSKKYRRE